MVGRVVKKIEREGTQKQLIKQLPSSKPHHLMEQCETGRHSFRRGAPKLSSIKENEESSYLKTPSDLLRQRSMKRRNAATALTISQTRVQMEIYLRKKNLERNILILELANSNGCRERRIKNNKN